MATVHTFKAAPPTEPTVNHPSVVAYFSMEIALNGGIPTYAGGLGVLAGDTARSAADMGIPFVVVTLLARYGYFRQRIDANGDQQEEPDTWDPAEHLTPMDAWARVRIEGREVSLRAWRYELRGRTGHSVPVYFLDADLPGNSDADRRLTDRLYGGDTDYRLAQEVILGMGGVRMLHALGHTSIRRYHMNEGHAALLVLELLEQQARKLGAADITDEHLRAVREQCVFTTHTPVPAGHDQFPLDRVRRLVGECPGLRRLEHDLAYSGTLNMTYLALAGSHYVNGVARRHGEVSQHMFEAYKIDYITNGIHVATWTAPPFRTVFDQHIPDWRADNQGLRNAMALPSDAIWQAHQACKQQLIDRVEALTGRHLGADVLTLGFARRMTQYKRPALMFTDVERLRRISDNVGPLQIIVAGKAHPRDAGGKAVIRQINEIARTLDDKIQVVYLPDYDTEQARVLTAGCDVWVNTPEPPLEASGTSGMKAAINGVPSLSVLDGWWIEGCMEGITGWAIGADGGTGRGHHSATDDADSFYRKLEHQVMPLYYHEPSAFVEIMRQAIAINGSFFNTERMLSQYVTRAYF